MRILYDPRSDTLTVIFKEDCAVADSDEEKPGLILDYDAKGELVSLEMLDASTRVTDARKMEFQLNAER